ncbi:TRAP transporter substrate-binding protein [Parvibium lacunae]|uniref:C4-dicarboxylate ABC transporter substrate-binding protein n=1 Tax=Parvibium lacunae TaxID=1888893 RepID=A0A368L1C1_9BURK|nr:TRAP transporter substrate-binding protein [Parvibium lacunae]RCS57366.1 C4-dicarboxylate ABC transporter substrate-binding protein [Parvibium lacunae]
MKLWQPLFATALSVALCGQLHADTKTLKLGHPQAPTSAFHAGAVEFAEQVGKLTNGRYKVEVFPSGSLGGEREMVESVQLGTLDFVVTSTGPVGNFVPDTLITDIPFLFRDYDHARKTLDGPIGQEILTKFPAKGLVGLAWGENGFRNLTNNKKAVNVPEDMKGLKLRTMENPVHMTAFRTLGAQPTPMAFTELFGALQQGTVDGQENPIPVIVSSKFGQVQKHLTLTGHVYSPALIITSVPLFNSLSAADKKVVQDAARLGAAKMRAKVNEIESSGLDALRKEGVSIVSTIDKAKFQSALEPAYAEYAKRFGADKIERIRQVK